MIDDIITAFHNAGVCVSMFLISQSDRYAKDKEIRSRSVIPFAMLAQNRFIAIKTKSNHVQRMVFMQKCWWP